MGPFWKWAVTPLIRRAAAPLVGQSLEQSALALIEVIVNQALKLDPITRAKLKQLDQRTLLIQTRGPSFSFSLHIQNQCIQLATLDAQDTDHTTAQASDAGIQGRCTQLLALLFNPSLPMDNDEIQLTGDIALINDIDSLVRQLDIDWGEPLSRVFGDTASGQIVRLLKRARHYGKDCASKVCDSTEDFIQYEQDWLATNADLHECFEHIKQLRMTQARTEQRIARLNRCVSALNSTLNQAT